MTIFRCRLLLAALLLPLLQAETAGAREQKPAPHDSCSNIDPSTERACVNGRIAVKERVMSGLLSRARKVVEHSFAAYGSHDIRTDPRHLDQSQKAWTRFVDQNCKVVAAFGGGSNSAISDRWRDCYEREVDDRISFLRRLAEQKGMFGL